MWQSRNSFPDRPDHTGSNSSLPSFQVRHLLWSRTILLLLVLGCVFSGVFGAEVSFDTKLNYVYLPVLAALLFTALSARRIRSRATSALFVYIQLSLDAFVVTAIVYGSGGPISPFLFLYLPLIMESSLLVSRSGSLVFSALCGAAYVGLTLALEFGILSPADGSGIVATPHGGLLPQIIGLCSGMILIAIATSYLNRAVKRARQQAAQSEQYVIELKESQSELMNSIPRGIITTNSEGTISSVNQAAQELLQIQEAECIGTSMKRFIEKFDAESTANFSFPNTQEVQGELKLERPGSQNALTIHYHGRPILTAEGDLSGFIFIVQDVTKMRSIEDQLALQERMARLLSEQSARPHAQHFRSNYFVGESKVMQKVFGLIERVAPSDATVLIHGESGTGKELVARAIHEQSPRSKEPFIAVNCGAIPETLLESELFGHKRGSFTGAHADHIGLFRQAERGTLFLDEIGELPLNMQSKLLRAIQEKTIRPIGAERDNSIDVRIVAASNRNLKQEILARNFREDLYYRLNVISINLPPLRERRDDIPLLIDSILRRLGKGGNPPLVTPQATQFLTTYNYPGNVRELENILERAFVLGGEVILPEHLPEGLRNTNETSAALTRGASSATEIIIDESVQLPANLDAILADIERRYLEVALLKTKGAKKKAASLLGMNFRSFRYRLQKFGIGDEAELE